MDVIRLLVSGPLVVTLTERDPISVPVQPVIWGAGHSKKKGAFNARVCVMQPRITENFVRYAETSLAPPIHWTNPESRPPREAKPPMDLSYHVTRATESALDCASMLANARHDWPFAQLSPCPPLSAKRSRHLVPRCYIKTSTPESPSSTSRRR